MKTFNCYHRLKVPDPILPLHPLLLDSISLEVIVSLISLLNQVEMGPQVVYFHMTHCIHSDVIRLIRAQPLWVVPS